MEGMEERQSPVRDGVDLLTLPGASTAPGGTVLCLPGLGAHGRTFTGLAPLCTRWRVTLWTPPAETPDGWSPLAYHVQLLRAADIPSRHIVIGSSFGSLTALSLALAAPERVRALVLVGPVAGVDGLRRGLLAGVLAARLPLSLSPALAPLLARALGGLQLTPESRALLSEGIRALPPRELHRRLSDVLCDDRRPALEALRVPTLVVQGTRDLLVPRTHAENVARRIPGARLHLIPGGSHVPYLSHTADFLGAVGPFLEALDAGASGAGAAF
jgi:pimeloyl-ACP methyl ester carboxylesterase